MPTTVATYAYDGVDSHTDHLNTPRLVADDTQTTVWKWEQQEPFGASAANDDPDGNAVAFEFNLRFPGQYFDKETALHYNAARDYDSLLGRYVQSDPIGLRGGLNTYLYVYANPLLDTDASGLFSLRGWLREKGIDVGPEVGAKTAGRQAGAEIGQSICKSGGPPDFRTTCIDLCLTKTWSGGSGFASDFQEGCQIECIRAVSSCRNPRRSSLDSCTPFDL